MELLSAEKLIKIFKDLQCAQVVDSEDLGRDSDTMISFKEHNRTGLIISAIEIIKHGKRMRMDSIVYGDVDVYAIHNESEPILDIYIHNLNTASPYRYSYNSLYKFHRCIFVRKSYLNCSPSNMDVRTQQEFIKNILACAINLVSNEFLGMDTNHINICAVAVTAIVTRRLGIALTPEFYADIVSTTPAIAERVLSIVGFANDCNIRGLPWYI